MRRAARALEVAVLFAASVAPGVAQAGPAKTEAPVHLTGRLLLPDGSPAAKAALHVQGWESNEDDVLRYGLPKDWKDLDLESAADGTFAIEFVAPRAYQFALDAKLRGYAAASWRWGSIAPGTTKKLGDVTFRKGVTIRGRIVDARGEPVRGCQWTVYADGPGCTLGDGAEERSVYVHLEAGNSDFTLVDVAPGRVRLKAHSSITNWIEGPALDVAPGGEVRADIKYSGPELSKRITVELFCRPFYIFEGDADEILLSAIGVEPRRAHKIENSSQSFCFDDVPPLTYTVEIHDSKFLPWSKSNVTIGSTVTADLVGNARIRLQVVDAKTGKSLPRYSLRVRFETNGFPNTFEVPMAGGNPPPDGVCSGLIPVNQVLLVHVDGYADCEVPERPLRANQQTEVVARMSRGVTLVGKVVRSDGTTPAPGSRLLLSPHEATENESSAGIVVRHFGGDGEDSSQREAIADANGAFRFDALPAGHYSLATDDEPPLKASIDDVAVSDSTEPGSPLVLQLPPRGYLTGRLLGPKGADFTGLRIAASAPDEDPSARFQRMSRSFAFDRDEGPDDRVKADGSFRIGPLGVGAVVVSLEIDPPRSPESEGGMTIVMTDGSANGIPLGKATIVDGQETRADFDVHETLPGRVQASVKINGSAVIGAVVEVVGALDPADPNASLNGPTSVAISTTGSDGVATVGPVRVGKFSLVVRAADRGWAVWPHVHLQMPAGGIVPANIAGSLHDGALVIVDRASNKPLARTQVSIGCDDGDGIVYAVSATSDDRGVVHLRLPAGDFHICSMVLEREDDARFKWTDHGPAVESVQIKKGD